MPYKKPGFFDTSTTWTHFSFGGLFFPFKQHHKKLELAGDYGKLKDKR